MYNIIDKYIQNMNKEDVNTFAKSKNIFLSDSELNFTYEFIKRNYEQMLKNPNSFNLDRYENNFSKENFPKIKKVYIEYFSKYHKFL